MSCRDALQVYPLGASSLCSTLFPHVSIFAMLYAPDEWLEPGEPVCLYFDLIWKR